MTQICHIMKHSPRAVNNYLATFARCVQLNRKEMQVGQIAFLLRRGKGLVQQYLDIITECESDKNTAYGNRFLVVSRRRPGVDDQMENHIPAPDFYLPKPIELSCKQ